MAEETKQKTKNIPMGLYFSFLREETPNIIQITTLLGFLSILLRNEFLSTIIPILVSILLWLYLVEKEYKFLKNQITDPYSQINRHKISDKILLKKWTIYNIITAIIFGFLILLLQEVVKIQMCRF